MPVKYVTSLLCDFPFILAFYTKRLGNNLGGVDCPDSSQGDLSPGLPNMGNNSLGFIRNCQGKMATRAPRISVPFLSNVTLKLPIYKAKNRTYYLLGVW